MRKLIFGVTIAAAYTVAFAGGADGVWKTELSDDGGYLEVTIGPCESDSKKTCGTISRAFTKDGENPDYKHLGKLMVWDMKSKDGTKFSGGKIWDPKEDKTYKSKMQLKGDELDVEGCVTIICSGQHWQRVK